MIVFHWYRNSHLRTLVSHLAKDAIAGLTLTDANYDEAIKVLNDQFGNKEKIISKHMEDGVPYKRAKIFGVSEEAYNCLLPPLIVKKLPREVVLSISRKIPEDEWSLSKIMSELSVELKARERTYDASGGDNHSRQAKSKEYRHANQKRSHVPPTTSAFFNPVGSIIYCKGAHNADERSKVTKVDERKQLLRDAGRFFVCTKQGHLSRGRRSSSRCRYCNGQHHSSVCFKNGSSEKKDVEKRMPVR
uniref:Uncharacterized protein n=1 Tax=Amphimedon queenslandica TaxID=400682 RepID=A0A1X7TBP0_AMPQE